MLKTKTERVLLLAVVFLAGCEASRVAQVMVPPAHAGEPAQRWEYACTLADAVDQFPARANKFGAQGWEIAGSGPSAMGQGFWCFKRPLSAAAAARTAPLHRSDAPRPDVQVEDARA
jgi:hypothetical protein